MAKIEILLLLFTSALICAHPTEFSYSRFMDFVVGAEGDVREKEKYSIANEVDSEIQKLPAEDGWVCTNSTNNVVKCVLKSNNTGVSGQFVVFHSGPVNVSDSNYLHKGIASVYPEAKVVGTLNDFISHMSKLMESTLKMFADAFDF